MLAATRFLGLECVRLENNALSLLITQSVGPRIVALQPAGGGNLFAEVPELTLECPDVGRFHFWGGHRLWHAPEVSHRTYLPDDRLVTITEIDHGLQVIQLTEPQTGLQKSLHIRLPDDSATAVVDHTLTNHNLWPIESAPWAITQLKPGGVAILPQPTAPADPEGVRPNRNLVLWPYTDVNSPHIQWGNQAILVTADMLSGALKLGFPDPAGWLAYHRGKTLFVKKSRFQPGAVYYDLGSSSQCYCNPSFLELETLAPRTTIAPGQSVTHREVWEVYQDVTLAPTEVAALEMAARFSLAGGSPYLAGAG
ncbi:MAG: DUF4380 domain-containing protein [Chloroflexi bacterium]|nr:DUF4380 domain-containing protein [Chloroflexota bacterium]MCI0578214.1 DUF4380 domain-containing protein [Chloroflexota bacterium]MCI0645293.1 DUF4380 domain-containing protein [Chloroflexota bacterium]MCI0729553.1 DUF4380 domain-containing protein [Chloroflexota bacterium]